MLTAETFLTPGPVAERRARRVREIHRLLHGHPPVVTAESPLAYALAHHFVEGAERAARAGDTTTFGWYRRVAVAGLPAQLHVHPLRLVLAPPLTDLIRSVSSDTPYYIVGRKSRRPDPQLDALVGDALTHAADLGFGELVAEHAPIICLLRRKNLDETLDSWTITRLPGTVYTDHVADPVVLARDLIHEAGHNWLNDTLTALAIRLPDEERFYSPWKQTRRPAFGFLHACWAFPLTVIYTTRILPATSGSTRDHLARYLHQQQAKLAEAAPSFPTAAALISDPFLKDRLETVFTEAQGL